jgi:hypothetical protein
MKLGIGIRAPSKKTIEMLELSSNIRGYRWKKSAVNVTMCFGIEC